MGQGGKRLGQFSAALILLAAMAGAMPPGLQADQFQDAAWAYEAGDYATAIKLWRPLAEQGDARSQMVIGIMFEDGDGLVQDYVRAHMWLNLAGANGNEEARRSRDRIASQLTQSQIAAAQKLAREGWEKFGGDTARDVAETLRGRRQAAARGDAGAQFSLGVTYDKGEGAVQDYDEAFKWYREGAAQGHPGAQSNLGGMYSGGKGVLQDHAEAAIWFHKAAAQDDAYAQFNLGILYETGQGLARDKVWAHMWLNLAGANGHKAARRTRDKVGLQMTPAQIAEAQAMARDWLAKFGRHDALEDIRAGRWRRKAAGQGDPGALFSLGIMYDMGHDVAQDHREAVKWYALAAARGHIGAQYNLGVMYYQGYGVAQDFVEALKWLKIANVFGPGRAAVERIFDGRPMTAAQLAETEERVRRWLAMHGR